MWCELKKCGKRCPHSCYRGCSIPTSLVHNCHFCAACYAMWDAHTHYHLPQMRETSAHE